MYTIQLQTNGACGTVKVAKWKFGVRRIWKIPMLNASENTYTRARKRGCWCLFCEYRMHISCMCNVDGLPHLIYILYTITAERNYWRMHCTEDIQSQGAEHVLCSGVDAAPVRRACIICPALVCIACMPHNRCHRAGRLNQLWKRRLPNKNILTDAVDILWKRNEILVILERFCV